MFLPPHISTGGENEALTTVPTHSPVMISAVLLEWTTKHPPPAESELKICHFRHFYRFFQKNRTQKCLETPNESRSSAGHETDEAEREI
jgi:hypothetical protein